MSYNAYIAKLTNVRKHPNADRLLLGDCFGNTVCVSLEYTEGQVGVYFPTDGQLSTVFAETNNLLRKKDDAGNSIGGYMDPDKRNVTAIRLRGEKSDGLFLPLSCLETFGDISILKVGDVITVFNGTEICTKYVPRGNRKHSNSAGSNRTRKKKTPIAPLFCEHVDTEQLPYNLSAFKMGDLVEITLKMHGTSQRTGYLPVLTGYCGPNWALDIALQRGFFSKFFQRPSLVEKAWQALTPCYDWGYVSGTRRVVLENFEGGYHGSNEFREIHSKIFEGKLHKGEEVFYEVVGFTTNGTSIMGDGSNKKLNDKEFVKQYGDTTVFSYGCERNPSNSEVPQSDIYVYRMTMTNEDGNVVEYTPDFMRYRCEQIGVKTVPVFWRGVIYFEDPDMTPGEYVKNLAEQFYDGPDPVGKTHVREGVVARIVNRPKFAAYKHKNFAFKCLEGIIKVDAAEPDMEEAEGEAE